MNDNKKTGNGSRPLFVALIILLTIALVGGGVFAGIYLSGTKNINVKEVEIEINEELFEIDEFLVNLVDMGSKRYVKIKVYASYNKNNKALDEELRLSRTKPILMDGVLSVLRGKSSEDFSSTSIENVKAELKEVINSRLKNGKISEVYFPELIVQ